MGKKSSEGTKSSDYDPSLPDNAAEAEAAKDSAKESGIEKSYSDSKAKHSADKLHRSITDKK
jgi:hypothetical protein